jgi:signal transduction histidine kinase
VAKLRSQHSQADYAAAFAKTSRASTWRYFVPTSATARSHAGRQFFNVQVAYLVGIHLILLSELFASSIDNRLLHAWYAESLGNLLLRAALFAFYFTRPPDAVANLRAVQLIPMLSVLIVGAHWAWTALLFVDPAWDFANFMTLTVFLLMSLATMAFVPASPAPMLTYWVLMWVPAAIAAWPAAAQGPAAAQFALILASVVALGVWAFRSQSQVRRYVQSGDGTAALIAQLREKNEELCRLRSEASLQLQERSHFFSSASHDFGQRLHAIKLLTHNAMATQEQAQYRCLTVLARAVEDLQLYVRDVLEFARIESRVVTPSYRVFYLQDLFQRLALQFESVADDRQVRLCMRTTTARVETDEGVLLRVLENLIGNAIKYTRGGVLVAARRRAGQWCIEVWDQGPGIPPGSLNQIFASFYQERAYADPQQVGFGLGLAIVKRFADGLKYTLEVQSRVGRGSVFKVLLPPGSGL